MSTGSRVSDGTRATRSTSARTMSGSLTQAQYDEHPVLARRFIEEGFERGDWSLVHVLARTLMGFPGDSNLFNAWPHGLSTPESAENAYKMTREVMPIR